MRRPLTGPFFVGEGSDHEFETSRARAVAAARSPSTSRIDPDAWRMAKWSDMQALLFTGILAFAARAGLGRVRPSESILPRSSRARSGPSAPAWQRLDDCNWNAHLLQGFKLRLAIRRGRGVPPWITMGAGSDARRWRPYARRHGPPSKS
jgi:hypothetical protein